MKILLWVCIVVFVPAILIAQHQPYNYSLEVIYKMSFQPDSTDSKSIKEEFATLLIGKQQSLFCATQYLVMDSAISSESSKGNKWGPPMSFFVANGTHNSLVIFKTANDIITFDNPCRFVTSDIFSTKELRSAIVWKILNDTMNIGGINCQRAEANFGNRKWIAWFAPSIPVSDGPYKFGGLPGLILRINDFQHYWNFDLASIKQVDKTIKISFWNKIPITLKSKKDFFETKKYMRDNRFQLQELSGDKFSNPAVFKKKFEEQAKKDNNWIELYNGK